MFHVVVHEPMARSHHRSATASSPIDVARDPVTVDEHVGEAVIAVADDQILVRRRQLVERGESLVEGEMAELGVQVVVLGPAAHHPLAHQWRSLRRR